MIASQWLLAQDNDLGSGGGAAAIVFMAVYLVLIIALIAGWWTCFAKAGKPGWAAIIPIYNYIVILEIAGKPLWWIILAFVPCVNLVVVLLVCMSFAKSFGKSESFGFGLFLLPFIFFPILGFGSAKYVGSSAA